MGFVDKVTFKNTRAIFFLKWGDVGNVFSQIQERNKFLGCPRIMGHGAQPLSYE